MTTLVQRRLGQTACAALLFSVGTSSVFAAPPTQDQMRAHGTAMGQGQRCGVAIAEVLLFSQLAKDLAQLGSDPAALQSAFTAAAAAAREGPQPDCKTAVDRFDASLDDLYKANGRKR